MKEISFQSDNVQAYTAGLGKKTFPNRINLQESNLKATLSRCIMALKKDFGYDSLEIYCFYKYTRRIERAVASTNTLPLREIKNLISIVCSGEVFKESDNQGVVTLYIPLPLPESTELVDTNVSDNVSDPNTHWGVLVAVSTSNPSNHSLNILKLAALEITHIFELYELLQYERNMVDCLNETRRISLNILPMSDVSQLLKLWSSTEIVRRLFDGMVIWLNEDSNRSNSTICYGSEQIRDLDLGSILLESNSHEARELYDIGVEDYYSVILHPLINGNVFIGSIGFFKSYKRILRSEERAVALLISEQISFNIQKIFLHKNLEEQNFKLIYEKEFNEKIFVCINTGIIVVTEAGKVLMANPYALNKFGFSLEEMTSSTLEAHVPGLLAAATSMQGEGVFMLSNQKEIHLGFSMSRLQYSDNLSGKIILLRDITEIVNLRKEAI